MMEIFEWAPTNRNPKDKNINLETTICHPSASQKSHVLKKAVFLQLKIEVERRK